MSLQGKTALVTGATGFLGGRLTRHLARGGVQVVALARKPERAQALHGQANIRVVYGDITDADRMREVAAGCDYVFHTAASQGPVTGLKKHRAVNRDGTRNVMLAAAAAGVERAVHVSSIGVYGFAYETDVTEDLPCSPGHVPYNISKAEAEEAVREVAAGQGLSFSIIRPAFIYGPGGGTWVRGMYKIARFKPTLFPGSGAGAAHPIYVDDVVDLMVLLAVRPAAVGETVNCAPDPAPTWREFLGAYSRLAGHDTFVGLPSAPILFFARALSPVMLPRTTPKALPGIIRWLNRRFSYSMAKARYMLGWEPRVDLKTGIELCRPYLRDEGLLK